MSNALKRRVLRLEAQGSPSPVHAAPAAAELRWARHVKYRYFELVGLWEILGPPFEAPPYTPADKDFIAECNAGLLAKAKNICNQDDRANGRGVWSDLTPEERERRHREIYAKYGLDPSGKPL
jgi:hypothetical protein